MWSYHGQPSLSSFCQILILSQWSLVRCGKEQPYFVTIIKSESDTDCCWCYAEKSACCKLLFVAAPWNHECFILSDWITAAYLLSHDILEKFTNSCLHFEMAVQFNPLYFSVTLCIKLEISPCTVWHVFKFFENVTWETILQAIKFFQSSKCFSIFNSPAQYHQSLRCSLTWSMKVDEGSEQNQTSSPTGWLRLRVWWMSLWRTESASQLYYSLWFWRTNTRFTKLSIFEMLWLRR